MQYTMSSVFCNVPSLYLAMKVVAPKNLNAFAWSLTATASMLVVYVWGASFGWELRAVNAYQFFPVLGLLAFSIMWAHYMVGALKRLTGRFDGMENYTRYTGYVVLVALVLHPGILVYQRFHDGFGLPPGSYESFVAPSMAWLTLLGTASFFIFLAYELRRWYAGKKWWKYVVAAGDLAMLASFYHGLRLGSQLQGGWFHALWLFYGATLSMSIVYKCRCRYSVA